MKPTVKALAAAFVVALILSSLLATSVCAQSRPKPAVPEVTLRFIPSYQIITHTDPYSGEKTYSTLDESNIEVQIKNQPFARTVNGVTYRLFYSVSAVGHFSESGNDWRNYYRFQNFSKSHPTPDYLLEASESDYTTVTIVGAYPADSQIDVVVEANLMYEGEVIAYDHFYDFIGHLVPGVVLGETSDANRQTFTIPTHLPSETASSTPAPTQNTALTTPAEPTPPAADALNLDWQTVALVVLSLVVAVLAVTVAVLWRKVTTKQFNPATPN